MDTEKKGQERFGLGRPLTDLEVQILELYRQLPEVQREIVLLSAVLLAAANDETAVQE